MPQATLWNTAAKPLRTPEEREALTRRLIETIETDIAAWAERTLTQRHVTALWQSEDGIHAGFMANPETGEAAYAITRRPDGTITHRIHGETVDRAPMGWQAGLAQNANKAARQEAAERLVQHRNTAMQRPGRPPGPQPGTGSPDHHGRRRHQRKMPAPHGHD